MPQDYRRELDIATGIHTTTFTKGGVKFTREAFASHPDQVMVFRYTASKPGALSGRISLAFRPEGHDAGDRTGPLFRRRDAQQAQACVRGSGAAQGRHVAADGEEIVFAKCDELMLLLDARTNYKPDYNAGWRGADPLPLVEKELAAAQAKSYDALRTRARRGSFRAARPRHPGRRRHRP